MLKWDIFVDQLKGVGYQGDPDSLEQVQLWLKRQGHATDVIVDHSSGEKFELQKLYEERPGKPIDVSESARRAEIQAQIDDGIKRGLEDIEKAFGKNLESLRPPERSGKGHNYATDIAVKGERLRDDPKGGYSHIGFFLKDVHLAGSEDRHLTEKLQLWQKAALGSTTVSQEGVGADGGFAAPPELRSAIEAVVMAEDSILGRTRQIPISGNGISFPADETTQWGTAGIQAYWEGETGTYTQSKVDLELKELKPRKVTSLVPVTEELLGDAPALGAYVTRTAGERIDFAVGEAIFRGTGAGQPLGFLNAGSTISQAAESSQASTTFVALNALKMWSRLYGRFRTGAIWFINQDVESELYRMSIPGRTGGGTDVTGWGGMLYIPPGGLSQAPYGTLMGRPVIPTQHCSTLGAVGDVCLCALDQYVTAIRGGLEAQTSIHLWFDQDAIAYKFRMRVDGQPWLNSVISPRAGSNTMSAFVTVAAR